MLERLLELFFHAKAGAIAGVLILGTTGALVTATVSSSANGTTTVTLTQAGTSQPATTLTLTSPTEPQTVSAVSVVPAVSATESVSTSLISAPQILQESGTTPTTCDPTQAAAANDAVKTVNSAYSQYHTDLAQLRKNNKSDAARTLLKNTDELLKEIRKNAVKAIHATLPCDNDNDVNDKNGNDKDADDKNGNDKDDKNGNDKNDPDEQGDNKGEHQNGSDDKTSSTATPPTTTVVTPPTGDVKKIADDAVAAMKLVFDTAKSQLPTTTASAPGQSKSVNSDSKGKKDGKHSDRD